MALALRSPRSLATFSAMVLANFGAYVLGMALSGWMVSGFLKVALRIHYGGFGFIKRGLIGTAAQPLLPDHSYPSLIHAALVFGFGIGALLSLASGLLLLHCDRPLQRLLFLVSPATLLQFGYTFSWFDAALYLIFICQLLLLQQAASSASGNTLRSLVIGLLGALALLIHEAYLLAAAPLLIWLCQQRFQGSFRRWLPLLPILATAIALILYGRYEPGPLELARQLGIPAQDAPLEFTANVSENLVGTLRSLWLSGLVRGSLPALAYLALLSWLALRSPDRPQQSSLAILLALSPLLLSLIGFDLPRWCAMAGCNLLLLGLLGQISMRGRPGSPWPGLTCLAALAGPVGVLGTSFPLTLGALGRIF